MSEGKVPIPHRTVISLQTDDEKTGTPPSMHLLGSSLKVHLFESDGRYLLPDADTV